MIDEKKLIKEIKDEANTRFAGLDSDLSFEEMILWINSQPKIGGWIPCSEGMPKSEEEVEITYTWEWDGKRHYSTARAFYEDGTLTTEDSSYYWEYMDNWEYDEEKDAARIPEGWWESVAFGEYVSAVDKTVIAWRSPQEPYIPTEETAGGGYREQIMDRFLRRD